MRAPWAIMTRLTTWPLMSRPRIAFAASYASSGVFATLTPPAFPRPPVLTCALTTTTPPIFSAAALASSGVSAMRPASTGTSYFSKRSRAWYSYRSTVRSFAGATGDDAESVLMSRYLDRLPSLLPVDRGSGPGQFGEVAQRGSFDPRAVRGEARRVQRAVPRALGVI